MLVKKIITFSIILLVIVILKSCNPVLNMNGQVLLKNGNSTPAYFGPYIYWTEGNGQYIKRATLEGTNIETIVDSINISSDQAFTIDPVNENLYWIHDNRSIVRSNLDGTEQIGLLSISLNNFLIGLAFDTQNLNLYYTVYSSGYVSYYNVSEYTTHSVASGFNTTGSVAVDSANGTIFWNDTVSHIKKADLDGSNQTTLFTNISSPSSLVVYQDKLYWTDNSSINDIVCCNLDGTNVETIITNQGFIKGVTFDPDNQKIYWVEYTAGTIKRANLNGSDVETVLDNLDHPKGIIFFSLE